jgi:transcriptional regulator with XRE-family HTH domain
MSLFTTQLQTCLELAGINRVELAAKTGIPYKTLSNYAAEIRPPDLKAMRAICAALPEELRGPLIIARLGDETPTEYRHLIVLESKKPTLGATCADYADEIQIPDSLQRTLNALKLAAVESEHWRVALDALASALESDAEAGTTDDQLKFSEAELAAARQKISATSRAAAQDRPQSA